MCIIKKDTVKHLLYFILYNLDSFVQINVQIIKVYDWSYCKYCLFHLLCYFVQILYLLLLYNLLYNLYYHYQGYLDKLVQILVQINRLYYYNKIYSVALPFPSCLTNFKSLNFESCLCAFFSSN